MSGSSKKSRGRPQSKDRRRGFIQLGLVLLFIGGALLLSKYLASQEASLQAGRSESRRRTLLVQTDTVKPQSYRLRFGATGTVQVRALTDIVPQVSGRVVYIDEHSFPGGVFGPETVLFRIEEADYRNEVDRLQAEVARARTQLKLQQAASEAAKAEWRQLHPDRQAPPLVAETPQLEEAEANLRAAEAGLRNAQLKLERTRYQLPFTGRVTEFRIEQGQYVVAGQSYGQAYRLASLEIDVPLPEQQLKWLQEAEAPEITVSNDFKNGQKYRAFLKRVSAKVDMQTRFARVVLGLRASTPELVPDVFVNVRFVGPERKNVWVLPLEALQSDNTIWVVGPENRLHAMQPPIIQINDRHAVVKSNGKTIQVVHGSLPEATEGTPVKIDANSNA